jgi:ribonuclease Z
MIEITFLGTSSGIPDKRRGHPAIVLEYSSETKDYLLFDCGEGTQLRLMMAGISFMKINKIFITHWHADHFAGLIPLLATMNLEKRKKELKIFGPEAGRFVKNILELGYFGTRFPIIPIDVKFIGDEINKIDETKDYEIFSIPTLHTVPSVAYCFKEKDRYSINLNKLKELGLSRGPWLKKLKRDGKANFKGGEVRIEDVADIKKGLKVVYTGDTKPCDNVIKISENADLLIHDATFIEEDEAVGKSHATVKDAAEIAKKANVKELILTHFSRRYANIKDLEAGAKDVFENTRAAYDFMKIKLKSQKL